MWMNVSKDRAQVVRWLKQITLLKIRTRFEAVVGPVCRHSDYLVDSIDETDVRGVYRRRRIPSFWPVTANRSSLDRVAVSVFPASSIC